MPPPDRRVETGITEIDLGRVGKKKILMVDDEPDILASMRDLLESSIPNVEVLTAETPGEGLELLRQEPVELVVSDFKMPEMDGLEFLRRARWMEPDAPRILITAFPRLASPERSVREAGVRRYLVKPLDPSAFVDVVQRILLQEHAAELFDFRNPDSGGGDRQG